MTFSEDYLESIPPIYRDVLTAFPRVDPARKKGYGLAIQTIYTGLENANKHYPLGEIRQACMNLSSSGVFEIRNEIFAHPTDLGEELIATLSGHAEPGVAVPPFPSPPVPA